MILKIDDVIAPQEYEWAKSSKEWVELRGDDAHYLAAIHLAPECKTRITITQINGWNKKVYILTWASARDHCVSVLPSAQIKRQMVS